MGLFGGSKSRSSTTEITNVTTNTTTQFRDIGLSGAAAVDLAEVLGATSVALARVNADTRELELTASGKQFSQLTAGASEVLARGERAVASAGQQEAAQQTAQRTILAVVVVGVVGLLVFGGKRR